jgi:hypothetical protein
MLHRSQISIPAAKALGKLSSMGELFAGRHFDREKGEIVGAQLG